MLNLMRHWWNQSIHQHKAMISDSQVKLQNRLRRKLFAGVLLEIEEANGTLTPQDFHAHWWITYQDAPRAPAPIILEPETIASRRQERRRIKKARKQGAGVNGTRRDPSRFELSQTTNMVLPTMAAALQTASTPKHRFLQMQFNAIN
ncbi:hypothetical protein PPTG_16413 [Phytophthora nicotianae INRA-310]|uniref:Uncharacterized protein n=1 Tax=Phytophthora nicotianae (strain INRA-310) TaxID=761204 RepID=W2PR42_PHYN3|nr:hypothetical protein PPTG_16413 [Phytophthora nicotianae INRA-310]ETN02460.1 hypothetical protein PPTG_16413 [Phytophthora nicotianae INRA-310]